MWLVIHSLNENNFADLCGVCRSCLYWQYPELFHSELDRAEAARRKLEWIVSVSSDRGTCGKIAYFGGLPVGFAQFAPAACLPRTSSYESWASGSLQDGVMFLSCLFVWDADHRGIGIGKALLESVIDELRLRGYGSLETFARRSSADNCSGPLSLYSGRGFRVIRDVSDDFPLVGISL